MGREDSPVQRIWSEMLPYDELVSDAVLALLRRHALVPIVAVRPRDLSRVAGVVRRCKDAGVAVALWPMLDDEAGRWASAANMGAYASFARRVLDVEGVRELAVDLEPPFRRRGLPRAPFAEARATLRELVREAKERGLHVMATVLPPVVFDRAWEEVLGTPVEGVGFDEVNVMAYTSLLEGWSLGVLGRADARALLAEIAGRAESVSLGIAGTGAFGNEPVYRSPEELRDDVRIALACPPSGTSQGRHTSRVIPFDLAGILRRPPAEAWLAALHAPAAAELPARTLPARALSFATLRGGRATRRVLGLAGGI